MSFTVALHSCLMTASRRSHRCAALQSLTRHAQSMNMDALEALLELRAPISPRAQVMASQSSQEPTILATPAATLQTPADSSTALSQDGVDMTAPTQDATLISSLSPPIVSGGAAQKQGRQASTRRSPAQTKPPGTGTSRKKGGTKRKKGFMDDSSEDEDVSRM